MARLKEYDFVRLERSLPDQGLSIGMIGAIVLVHDNGRAYEVEFCDSAGVTLAIVTLEATDIELVTVGSAN